MTESSPKGSCLGENLGNCFQFGHKHRLSDPADNLGSFLISRNYAEGLIVLRSPWKWNMLHRGLAVKDIACRSYIIERSWMSNQWKKMQQKQQYASAQKPAKHCFSAQRRTCVLWITSAPELGIMKSFLIQDCISKSAINPFQINGSDDNYHNMQAEKRCFFLNFNRKAQKMKDVFSLSSFSAGLWWRLEDWQQETDNLTLLVYEIHKSCHGSSLFPPPSSQINDLPSPEHGAIFFIFDIFLFNVVHFYRSHLYALPFCIFS